MVTVVKCGGGAGIDADRVCGDVAQLVAAGQPVVLVHGGAGEIDRLAAQLGLARRTLVLSAGTTSRYNDPATLDALTMAMTGRVKPRLLAALAARGVPAVGLTGLDASLLVARRKSAQKAEVDGRTVIVRDDLSGRIVAADPTLPRLLLDAGMTPVVSPPAAGQDGQPLNVDADRAAAALAVALGATRLVLLTAAPGVLSGGGVPVPRLALPASGPVEVGWSAGMRRKLGAARDALAGGVGQVVVADGRVERPIAGALAGHGTTLTLAGRPGGDPGHGDSGAAVTG
jgi:[amino group carrier protein]-L-2-aminoadipate 6-kinase